MQTKPIRILVIEDDPEQASLVSDFLTASREKTARFELETTDHLAQGIERLHKSHYDIILLDLNLPDSHGLETFVKLSTEASKIPIIPLTGSGDEKLALEVMSLGAQDYLVKGSFNAGLLKRAILYAIERKRLIGQMEDLITKNADGMVVVDAGGWVRQVNPKAEKILGIKAELLIGKPFEFPIFPDQVTELKFPTPDGQEKVAEMRTTEIEWEGKPACLASIRDVTELKRLEQLKAEIKEHHRLDKLKDDFMANVSSELRAPLTVLQGALHNLLTGAHGSLNTEQSKTAEMARKGADRLTRAINNILDISQLESGKSELHRKAVQVEPLFKKAIANYAMRIRERGVAVEMQIASDLPAIDADEDLMLQTIMHILDNALRFARNKIVLKAESVEGALPASSNTVKRHSELGITLVSSRRGVQISVYDDGLGVSKEKLDLLFKKFVHIDRSTPNGAGLGLAICKQIVQSHRGRIWAESVEQALDQGTQIHFIIPEYQGSPANPLPTPK